MWERVLHFYLGRICTLNLSGQLFPARPVGLPYAELQEILSVSGVPACQTVHRLRFCKVPDEDVKL